MLDIACGNARGVRRESMERSGAARATRRARRRNGGDAGARLHRLGAVEARLLDIVRDLCDFGVGAAAIARTRRASHLL
jgi:hypothetical protein